METRTIPQTFEEGYQSVFDSLFAELDAARESMEAAANIGGRVEFWGGRIVALNQAIEGITSHTERELES